MKHQQLEYNHDYINSLNRTPKIGQERYASTLLQSKTGRQFEFVKVTVARTRVFQKRSFKGFTSGNRIAGDNGQHPYSPDVYRVPFSHPLAQGTSI